MIDTLIGLAVFSVIVILFTAVSVITAYCHNKGDSHTNYHTSCNDSSAYYEHKAVERHTQQLQMQQNMIDAINHNNDLGLDGWADAAKTAGSMITDIFQL